ncbi:hypothetical protein RI129_012357 [Pyrocoelia pectoralis]|uniref:C2H2-type domain-containing protein n=1 Tax=Pyrocoelia pectoralis TaxID=417401 RepID=A0AAN7ZC16_9COLE
MSELNNDRRHFKEEVVIEDIVKVETDYQPKSYTNILKTPTTVPLHTEIITMDLEDEEIDTTIMKVEPNREIEINLFLNDQDFLMNSSFEQRRPQSKSDSRQRVQQNCATSKRQLRHRTAKEIVCSQRTLEPKQNLKEFSCEHCKYTTKWRHCLKLHTIQHAPNREKYNCDKCSYRTHQMHRLRKHFLLQHISKLFKCDRCEYGSNGSRDLKKHFVLEHSK